MTKIQRLKRISKIIYNPKNCHYCSGTGRLHGKNGKYSGCMNCFVRAGQNVISDRTLKWLLKEAGL